MKRRSFLNNLRVVKIILLLIYGTNIGYSQCSPDVTPPNAICQDVTIGVGGVTTLDPSVVDNGSSDICDDPVNLAVSPNMFDCGDLTVGTSNVNSKNVTVMLTVTDNSTNSSTCTANVLLQRGNPTAVCQDATLQVVGTAEDLDASIVDGGSSVGCNVGFSLSVSPNMFDCGDFTIGTSNVNNKDVTVTLTVTDNNSNTSTCAATVQIQKGAPDAICMDATLQLDANGMGTLSANDVDNSSASCAGANLSVSPNNFTCSEIGANIVTLTASNNFGSNTCTAVVAVQSDALMAVCTDATVQLDNGGSGALTGSDVDGGSTGCDISLSVSPNSFSCVDIGPNTVTLTASSGASSSTCTAVATVEENQPPNAVCQDITLNVGGPVTLDPALVDNGSADVCPDPVTLSVIPNMFDCGDLTVGTSNVNSKNVAVTLTVTDNEATSSTCTANVLLQRGNPTAVCQDYTLSLTDPDATILSADLLDGGSSTACGDFSVSITPNAFSCAEIGSNTITLMVQDDSNSQTSTCTAVVTVNDDNSVCCDPPVAVCMDYTLQLPIDSGSGVFLDPANVDGGSVAECGLQSLSVDPDNFDCDDLGTHTVTLTVTDNNDDVSTCTATVTVEGLLCGWTATEDGINCADGNAPSYDPGTGTFFISSEGCYDPAFYSNTDSHGYVGTSLCGDGEIIAHVTQVDGNGFAGISMREDLTSGSKMLQLSVDGVFLSKRELRQATGGLAFNHLFQTQGKNWLRLTRSGNTFGAYHSTDGVNWQPVIVVQIQMPSCIEVGLITENNTPSGVVTGTFEAVEIKGGVPLVEPTNPGFDVAHEDYSFDVFPNPTTGETFVKLDDYIGRKVNLTILNTLGQTLEVIEIDEVELPKQLLDLRRFDVGMYYIRLETIGRPAVTKQVILTRS